MDKVIRALKRMTEMANWEFYDENEEIEGADDHEPSFSLYDFKKWLDSQGQDIPSFKESVDNKAKEAELNNKETLKEQFKQRVRDRVKNNINKRLSEKKKRK